MFVRNWLFLFGILLVLSSMLAATRRKMVVTVPVANVRAEPVAAKSGLTAPALSKDIGCQETQLLFGEHVVAEPDPHLPGWLKIEALEQKRCYNNQWTGYPGYIQERQACAVECFPVRNLVAHKLWVSVYKTEDDNAEKLVTVSIGTKFSGEQLSDAWWRVQLPDKSMGYVHAHDVYEMTFEVTESVDQLRKLVTQKAHYFIGSPYVWGGRSAYDKDLKNQISSVDCSGIIDLLFRAVGLNVPRDAHDQFLASTTLLDGSCLKPGDFIFLARPCPSPRMNHVVMYMGDDMLLEATGKPHGEDINSVTQTSMPEKFATRLISCKESFGKSCEQLTHNSLCDGGIRAGTQIFLGTVLGSDQAIQKMRFDALYTFYEQ